MVGKYILWLSRSQHTLVLRHLDLEYGSFVSGVPPPSSHAADPGDQGGGGGNMNVAQYLLSTQRSAPWSPMFLTELVHRLKCCMYCIVWCRAVSGVLVLEYSGDSEFLFYTIL